MKYADVVIDNKSSSTDSLFTYACSAGNISVGSKVRVSFGKGKKLRDAYVVSLNDDITGNSEELASKIKEISEVDGDVVFTEEMVRTAMWMKGRYLCRYIDAFKCFAPVGKAAVRRKERNSLAGEKGRGHFVTALTREQKHAISEITDVINKGLHDRFLIHGVTGSGKTEVYIRAAEAALKKGKGVIVLVPEISLTGQTIEKFLGNFGEGSVAVLHSRLSAGERYDQWMRIRKGDARIVIGARSAAFAPVKDLGLVVVDEEHESTYKSDFMPKYDTVEVVLKRLQDRDNNGVLVLGSATPSIVTYSRAEEGIFRLIELTKRYNDVKMPDMEVVDMRIELKEGNRSVISRRLASEIKAQTASGRQVMLFLNRRGYSTFVSCRECGYVAKCPTCGLSLVFHKAKDNGEGRMVCHYCGYEEAAPTACPECGSTYIRYFGSGTEKIEETVKELLPNCSAERVDLDSIKRKGELKRKLRAFEKGQIDILIGTQLIAKGLDFKNVGLVGVISADASLNIPDFRSPERTFQLITQAAGRAGRGDEEGRVIIQTYDPGHYAVSMAARQDYRGFYETEKKFRKYMMYPPYSDIFQILFTADTPEAAKSGADRWHSRLKELLGEDDWRYLFPPHEAYMSKVRETYRYSLIIKCPKGKRKEYAALIHLIQDEEVVGNRKKRGSYVAVVDVNPYSFM